MAALVPEPNATDSSSCQQAGRIGPSAAKPRVLATPERGLTFLIVSRSGHAMVVAEVCDESRPSQVQRNRCA